VAGYIPRWFSRPSLPTTQSVQLLTVMIGQMIDPNIICKFSVITMALSCIATKVNLMLCIDIICFCVIHSSLIVGTKTGYRLYSLNSVDKLENIYESGKTDNSLDFS